MTCKSFIFIVCLLSSVVCARASDDERLAVPKSLEQIKADKPIREKYKAQLASRDPAERLALAKTFRQSAGEEKDSTLRYVLLLHARDLSVSSGDLPLCMTVIDDIAKAYSLNDAEMKASALSSAIDVALIPPGELAQSYLKVADDALAEWNLDLAHKAAYLGRKVAKGDGALVAQLDDRDHTARLRNQEVLKVVQAERQLARTPDDPRINLIIGRHLCFNTNHWDNGRAFLAKGPAGPLKDLAEKDLANPTDPAAMAALADGWWAVADPKNNVPPGAGRRRAAYWYAKALPALAGEQRAEAEKRIAEVAGDEGIHR